MGGEFLFEIGDWCVVDGGLDFGVGCGVDGGEEGEVVVGGVVEKDDVGGIVFELGGVGFDLVDGCVYIVDICGLMVFWGEVVVDGELGEIGFGEWSELGGNVGVVGMLRCIFVVSILVVVVDKDGDGVEVIGIGCVGVEKEFFVVGFIVFDVGF